ncbi:dGTPase [Thiogranum longum]|uniref:Deoxyguanosinetriphosphate triphosphohydrolase-like protein n=1 Tax=Thiogranum longum TaxID=1537524 RepID=A0A4R1H924_9GAMM|nr:deoxyguanosinetriphosphate triphosphohydrolase [Thiogranum longum]TCK17011.1 dGTPase [Thiogranum longum]
MNSLPDEFGHETGLAPYAARDAISAGRRHDEPPPNYRSEYQRDRDRIIHAAAFRRLEYKTQVFVNHEGDLFRTRLTHSIEVAQIARSIARALRLNEDLTEAIALAHDLGHTPFGHAGQDALNGCMKEYGGFEHNLQSLRVVDELEEKYADFPGLNLTFETREGILKHCSPKNAAELGDVGERFLHKQQPGLEAQLTNLADEIAYNSHDVDDGLRAGLIEVGQLNEVPLFAEQYSEVTQRYPALSQRRVIHEVVRRLINCQVVDLVETSQVQLAEACPADLDAVRRQPQALITFSDAMRERNLELKRFLRNQLYRHYRVHRMSAKARRVIRDLFIAFNEDPQLLPDEAQEHVTALRVEHGESGQARGVADYIAGMTDRYAIGEHHRVYNPGELT